MQAPPKSNAVAAPAQEPVSVLLPTLVAVVATVTLLFLLAPAVVSAQVRTATPPTTGTTSGSAQGALAAQTADKGDAAPKEAPKALPKGTKAPSRSIVTTTEAAAKPKAEPRMVVTSPAVTVAAAEDSVVGAMAYDAPVNAVANKIWGADIATQRGARGGDVSTIFLGHAYDPVETEDAVLAVLPPRTVRPRNGEYAAAPYAVASANLLQAGSVGRRSGSAGGSVRGVERLLLIDDAEITLPTGTEAVVGARFVSVDADALVKPGVQIVSPTGVLEIVRVESGKPVVARVIQQTGRIEEGQKLLPLEGRAIGSDVPVAAVQRAVTAPETEVSWVAGDALLPSVQSFLMLAAGEHEGVKAGDQFALVKRQGLGPDAAEQRIALVRVVRVTAFGSTAIVIRQDRPGIAVGGAARLVGRVP